MEESNATETREMGVCNERAYAWAPCRYLYLRLYLGTVGVSSRYHSVSCTNSGNNHYRIIIFCRSNNVAFLCIEMRWDLSHKHYSAERWLRYVGLCDNRKAMVYQHKKQFKTFSVPLCKNLSVIMPWTCWLGISSVLREYSRCPILILNKKRRKMA